jgi:hypothetical protein
MMARKKRFDPCARGAEGTRQPCRIRPSHTGAKKYTAAHGQILFWRSSTFGEYVLEHDGGGHVCAVMGQMLRKQMPPN